MPVMGARQTRHGLQPAFGLTSNSSAEFCLATAGAVMLEWFFTVETVVHLRGIN